MLRAHTHWPARRMKRIAEAYEPARFHVVGDHARDSPAHRLAADYKPSSSAQPPPPRPARLPPPPPPRPPTPPTSPTSAAGHHTPDGSNIQKILHLLLL